MSQEATGVPAMPRAGHGQTKAKAGLLLGTDRKGSRLSRTRQELWDNTRWNDHRSSRATAAPRGTRAKGTAHGRSEVSPENAARERSRVRTLRQAFLALQAALPAVPPDTKLSKLDVLVLATSYIAHLTQTLGHELPGPAWPPFLRGLRYLHPLKGDLEILTGCELKSPVLTPCYLSYRLAQSACLPIPPPSPAPLEVPTALGGLLLCLCQGVGRLSKTKWPMRSRLYAGGLGCSSLDSTPATAASQRTRDEQAEEAMVTSVVERTEGTQDEDLHL